jgi:hypothetical protein
MKFKKGDKVKFLNDTGGGEITQVISKDMVNVLNEDGFEVPVLMEELLKIEEEEASAQEEAVTEYNEPGGFDSFGEEEPEPENLDSATDPNNNMYLAFVPVDQDNPQNSDLQVHLINDSDFYAFYLILLKGERSYSYFASGVLEDNTKIYLKKVERENLSELKDFKVQFIYYQKAYFKPVPPYETDLKLKPQKFYKSNSFTENDFFDEYAHLIEIKQEAEFTEHLNKLTDKEIQQVIQEKEQPSHKTRARKKETFDSDIEEVDLHIEELVNKPKELSNREMLDVQMDKFHSVMQELLKKKNKKKVVFIHGVGNGRLRYELRSSLERNYSNLDYQDASFKEYGYGATLVYLK